MAPTRSLTAVATVAAVVAMQGSVAGATSLETGTLMETVNPEDHRFALSEMRDFNSSPEGRRLVIAFACLSLFYMWPYQTIIQTQSFLEKEFPDRSNVGLVIMLCCTWPLLVTHSLLSFTGAARHMPYTCKVVVPMGINLLGAAWLGTVMMSMKGKAEVIIWSLYGAALLLSVAESFIEPAVYDMAGLMPSTFTSLAVQAGNGACGLVVSLIQVCTRLAFTGLGPIDKDQMRSLTFFFFVLMACTSLANVGIYVGFVRRTKAYRNYVKLEGSHPEATGMRNVAAEMGLSVTEDLSETNSEGSETRHGSMLRATMEAVRHVWRSALAISITFLVTLSLWPAVPGRSCAVPPGQNNDTLQSWWFDIVIFVFNLGDFVGKVEKRTLSWGAEYLSPGAQLALSLLRAVVFFPLILTAGAPQMYSAAVARWVNLVGVLFLGLTNGWLSTVCFMRAPKALPAGTPNAVAEQASAVLVVGLFLGISLGCLLAWILGSQVLVNQLGVCYQPSS